MGDHRKTHCKRGHLLSPDNVIQGDSTRECRICGNARRAAYKRKRRLNRRYGRFVTAYQYQQTKEKPHER